MRKGLIIGGVSILVVSILGMIYSISRPDDVETQIARAMAEHRRHQALLAAEAGDAWAMNMLYLIGESSSGKKDKNRALELMSLSDSPTAQYFHFSWTHNKKQRKSKEGLLARVRFTKENLRIPFQTDEEYARQSVLYRNSMDSLKTAGANGDSDASWVLAQLE